MVFNQADFEQLKHRLSENIGQLLIIDRELIFRSYAKGCFDYGYDKHRNHRFAGFIEEPGFAEDLHPRYGNRVPLEFVLGYATVNTSLDFSNPWFRERAARMYFSDVSPRDISIYPADFKEPTKPYPYEENVVTSFKASIGNDEVIDFLAEKYSGNPRENLEFIEKALKKESLSEHDFYGSSVIVNPYNSSRIARRLNRPITSIKSCMTIE